MLTEDSKIYYYQAYGLTIQSTIQLPELHPLKADIHDKPDVAISLGKITGLSSEARNAYRYIDIVDNQIFLAWEDVGAFLIQDGNQIIVDPNSGVSEHILRLFILGTTLAMLLHQRREVTVLHASVVAIESQAVGFVGAKGAGKSTMAAALHMRGHHLIADDILAIKWQDQLPYVLPGFPHMKLWPDSVSVLQREPGELPRLRPELEKRGYRLAAGFSQEAIPLHTIFTLNVGEKLDITPLPQKEAFMALIPHWYGARFGEKILSSLGMPTHFWECTRVAKHVEIGQLTRPRSLMDLPLVAQKIEEHIGVRDQTSIEQEPLRQGLTEPSLPEL